MTSRRTFLGLAGAAGAAALAGCSSDPEVDPALGPPATPDTKDEITFGIWDKTQEPAMIEIVDAFQQHFPGIGVSISTTAFGPNFELYASHGMLQDLSELEGFDPANYPPNLVELYTYEGTPYAVPKDFDTIALWFNRDLLHRAGVDEPTGNWSWGEYRDASEAVTRALGGEQIWGNPGGVANQAMIYPLIMQAGGFVHSEDKTRSGYGEPAAIEAFGFLDGMIRDGIAPDVRYTAENQPKDLFSNGRAALYLSGNWEAALLQDSPVREHLGVAPLIHGAEEANRIQAEAGAADPAFLGTNDAYIAAFMAMLPLMILFIVLQRRVVEGLAHSGMKG